MKKIIIFVAVLVIALVVIFTRGSIGGSQQVSSLDATDTAGGFYEQWLKALQEPEVADPDLLTLARSPILSKMLRTRLGEALGNTDTTVDPVLCQAEVPENIALRNVYEREGEAKILVTSRDKSVTNQAIVALKGLDDGWYIDDIECSAGEFDPNADREFTFEHEGFLLKDSIPSPYDSSNWHLVFEQDGEAGHVVPLIFDSSSMCTDQSGSKSTCDLGQFSEAMNIFVQGQLTELGLDVVNVEFK